MNTDQLVETFIVMRDERDRIRKDWKQKDAAIEEEMIKIEQALLTICNESGAKSIRTDKGTVIRKLNERFVCTDWEHFREYVLEHQALELLEPRISQGNFKEFIAGKEAEGLPPGVNVMREFTVVVRKPTVEV